MRSPQEEEDFKKHRNAFLQHIRQTKHEEHFNKKRKANFEDSLPAQVGPVIPEEQLTNKLRYTFVDPLRKEAISKFLEQKYFPDKFPDYVRLLYSNDIIQKHEGLIGVRKIVSASDTPPVHLIFEFQILHYVVELMRQITFPQLRLQAAWILTNVATGQPEHVKALVDQNTIPDFIQLVLQNQDGIVDQAIWALGNLAGDSPIHRDKLLEEGALEATVKMVCETKRKGNIIQGAWALSNLCRGTPPPNYEKVKVAMPVMCKIIQSNILDEENLCDCLWAVHYLTEGPKVRIQSLIETGVIQSLIVLAKEKGLTIKIPTLRIIGSVSTGNQTQTEQLLKNGLFEVFEELVDHQKSVIRRECCWILSNVAAGTKPQIDQFLDQQKLMEKILRMFEVDSQEVKREICYIFSNMTYLGDREKVYNLFIKKEILRFYLQCLQDKSSNKLIECCLDTLQMIFQFGKKLSSVTQGVNLMKNMFLQLPRARQELQQLQQHSWNGIYEKTVKILRDYFQLQETDTMEPEQ